MSLSLIKQYINLFLKEIKLKTKKRKKDIEEFSGAGAIAGYVLPLGMSNDDTKKKK